jgi:PAS domain S-box-containing protein
LKLALNAGQIGVWDWDIIQNRIEWPDLVYRIHGVERGTFAGGMETFARLLYPDDRDRNTKSIQAALDLAVPYEVEFRVIHSNGDTRRVSATAQVLRNEKGEPIRMLGATIDITARRQAEVEFRRKNRDEEEFAFLAGHDLREPLRAVNIYTELIIKRLGGEDLTLNQYANFVRQGITRMDALLDHLLKFSPVVLNEDQTTESAGLSAPLDDALSLLQNSIRDSGAVVSVEPQPGYTGTLQMTHVFQNLLADALKYRKKEVRPEIHVSGKRQGNQSTISMGDRSIGHRISF